MGQNQSNSRTLGSLNRFPKLQNDLRKIYKHLNPGKTRQDTIEWATALSNETRIRTAIEEFEIEVFGTKTTTIAAGSNAVALPTATINVASTNKFPIAGTITITTSTGTTHVAYTGATETTFTGCTGGSGTLATGNAVRNAESVIGGGNNLIYRTGRLMRELNL